MNARHRHANARRYIVPAFFTAVLIAILCAAPALAAAATFSAPVPGAGSTVAVSPAQVSVTAEAAVPILGTPLMSVDGRLVPAALSYAVVTPGYWGYNEELEYDYWVAPVYDYTRAVVSCAPGKLGDGTRAAAVTLPAGNGTYSWSFGVAEKPVIGAVTPASGTTTAAATPAITAVVTDNTGVSTWSATIDGAVVPATYDAAASTLRLTPASIANNAAHSAAISVADAAGNTATKSWTFTVAAPVTTWSKWVPAPGAVITTSAPTGVAVDLRCTSPLIPTSKKVVFDGAVCPTVVWLKPAPADPTRASIVGYPATVGSDGTHTVAVTAANTGGNSSTETWTYSVRIPPKLGAPTPGPGSTVSTTSVVILVPATDNGTVALATATINGASVPAAWDAAAGKVRITPASPLPADALATVAVSVFDSVGSRAELTWSFMVEARDAMAGSTANCEQCHAGIGSAPDMTPDCELCHIDHVGAPSSYHARADVTSCKPCHASSLLVEHARTGLTCVTCHRSSDTKVTGAIATGDSACATCHGEVSHEQFHLTTISESCVGSDCHAGTSLTSIHINAGSALTCLSCHESADTGVLAAISGHDRSCGACHSDVSGGDGHVALHQASLGSMTSVDAHIDGSIPPIDCVTCHGSDNLITLHAGDCSVCHSGPRESFATWNKGCQQGACHTSIHPDASAGHSDSEGYCENCHEDSDWSVDCTGCHITGDVTPPTTVSSPAGVAFVGSMTFTLSATDDAGPRGVKDTYYSLDGGPATKGTHIVVPAPETGSASHRLEYWSTDWSANQELPHPSALFTVSADTEAPVTTSDAKTSYVGPATIRLTPTDNGSSGVKTTYYRFDDGALLTGTTAVLPQPSAAVETHAIHFWSDDHSGNTEAEHTATFTVTTDGLAPTTTSNLLPAPKYYPSGKLSINLYPSDPSPSSGIAGIHVESSNPNAWWGDNHEAGWNATAGNWQLGMWAFTSGQYPVTWYARDNAGNVEAAKTTTISVDADVPVTGCDAQYGWTYAGPRTFTLSATDAGGSGLAGTWWRLDNSGAWTSGTSVPVTAPVSASVYHTLSWYSRDNAGNQGSGSVSFYMAGVPDTAAPAGSVTINAGSAWTNTTAVSLTASATDNVAVTQMRYSNDNVSWSGWETFSAAKSWALAGGNATKTVYAQFRDAAGNVSATANDTIGLDATAPSTTSDAIGGSTSGGPKTVTLTPSDTGGSGLAGTWWQLDSTTGSWTSGTSIVVPASASGVVSHTVYWYSKDVAGNTETTKSVTFFISGPLDTSPPTGSLVANSGAAWTNSAVVSLTASATDDAAVTQMRFSNDNATWSAWETYSTAAKSWTVASGNGARTVYAQYRDAANNVSASASDGIGLDTVSPVTGAAIDAPATGSGRVTLAVTESGSGVQSTRYILTTNGVAGAAQTYATAIPLIAPSVGSNAYSVEYWSIDNATNTESPHKFTGTITINPGLAITTLTVNLPYDSRHADMWLEIWDDTTGVMLGEYFTQEDHSASLTVPGPAGHDYTMYAEWSVYDYDGGGDGSDSRVVTAAEATDGAAITWDVPW